MDNNEQRQTMIDISRITFLPQKGDERSRESIRTGCLQRIAAATEAMAQNHNKLIQERDFHEQTYKLEREDHGRTERSLTATRGVVTKLRKKIAQLEQMNKKSGDKEMPE